jgi:UDP-N-acetyl-D-mannosaminuronate dehydrogenase
MTTRHLVIGYGEVGRALYAMLMNGHPLHSVDAEDITARVPQRQHTRYDGIHICTPFTSVIEMQATIEAACSRADSLDTIVVVHSTVPLGTTRQLAEALSVPMVYSPIRGTHPDLRDGLKQFPKYVGGARAGEVASWFRFCGMTTRVFGDPETPEAMKLWDTTQYGWQIVLAKEIARWCRHYGLDFAEVYQQPNREYNEGYERLGKPEVVRPWLKDMPGPIGGHCVMPNLTLLGPTFIANGIAAANARYWEEVNELVDSEVRHARGAEEGAGCPVPQHGN